MLAVVSGLPWTFYPLYRPIAIISGAFPYTKACLPSGVPSWIHWQHYAVLIETLPPLLRSLRSKYKLFILTALCHVIVAWQGWQVDNICPGIGVLLPHVKAPILPLYQIQLPVWRYRLAYVLVSTGPDLPPIAELLHLYHVWPYITYLHLGS